MTDRRYIPGRWDAIQPGLWVRLVTPTEATEFRVKTVQFGLVSDLGNLFYEREGWNVFIEVQPIVLPTEPGTVIAIGSWWFVRLRSYEGAPPAWELLPMPSKKLTDSAQGNGFAAQCVYGDDTVLAEAEQEGSFRIVSQPTLEQKLSKDAS